MSELSQQIADARKALAAQESNVIKAQLEVQTAERVLAQRKLDVEILERKCYHQWGEAKYNPIITPGGYDPGDAPGTMGVDFRGPHSWGSSEKPRWTRTCKVCGKTETTTQSQKVDAPRFN